MSDLEQQSKYKIGDSVAVISRSGVFKSTIKTIALHRDGRFRYQVSGVSNWLPESSLSGYSPIESSEAES